MGEPIDIGERIRQLRAIEAKMKQMEEEFEKKMKPFDAFVENTRAFLMQYLNQTNQRSAQTDHGGIYKKAKVTYRVTDKDSWRRHIIGTEMWELLSWAAAPSACEQFTTEHNGTPPPGLTRDSRLILHVTAPIKPRKRKTPEADVGNGEREEVAEETTEDD